jgi:hypothetical protein
MILKSSTDRKQENTSNVETDNQLNSNKLQTNDLSSHEIILKIRKISDTSSCDLQAQRSYRHVTETIKRPPDFTSNFVRKNVKFHSLNVYDKIIKKMEIDRDKILKRKIKDIISLTKR